MTGGYDITEPAQPDPTIQRPEPAPPPRKVPTIPRRLPLGWASTIWGGALLSGVAVAVVLDPGDSAKTFFREPSTTTTAPIPTAEPAVPITLFDTSSSVTSTTVAPTTTTTVAPVPQTTVPPTRAAPQSTVPSTTTTMSTSTTTTTSTTSTTVLEPSLPPEITTLP